MTRHKQQNGVRLVSQKKAFLLLMEFADAIFYIEICGQLIKRI